MRGTARGLRAAWAVVVTGVVLTGLAGCGVVERVMATPTITELPSAPDVVTPTMPVDGASGSAPVATVTPDASAGATPSSEPDRSGWPDPSPLEATELLVVVDTLGIGFAAPALFMEVDPDKYVEGSAALDELAEQMGVAPDALRTGVLNQVDRMVVGRGDDGKPASVIVARLPLDTLPTEAVIRREVFGMLDATVTAVKQVMTPTGPVVRAVYHVGPPQFRQYGEQLYVAGADGAVVSVTMTSFSASESQRMGARVTKTLRTIG